MKKKWLEIAAHLAFWVLTTWVLLRIFTVEDLRIEIINGVKEIEVVYNATFRNMLLSAQVFQLTLFYFILYFIEKLNRGESGIRQFWLWSLGTFAGVYLVNQLIAKLIFLSPEPLLSFNISLGITGFYFAIALAAGFTKSWIKKEQDRQRLSTEKKEAELNLLRSQLHPHFLFNTLNNLLAMAQHPAHASLPECIGRLSELLRFSIYETQGGSISLKKEISFLQNFIELNLIRYEQDEIDFRFSQDTVTADYCIEPGILLPFVENAFKYGVMPEEPSFIHLALKVSETGVLTFTIKNSIHSTLDQAPLNRGGVGLHNTRRRLELIYPGKHQLQIEEEPVFTVKLSIQLYENHHC